MATKTINDKPTVADTVKFTIKTPDATGCFSSQPYQVKRVVIYYIERDFVSGNFSEYDIEILEEDIVEELEGVKQQLCSDASNESLQLKIAVLEQKLQDSKKQNKFYFNHATPVQVFGFIDPAGVQPNYPAWLNPELVPVDDEEQVEQDNILIETDEIGHFNLFWEPLGQREGNYFICWEWMPIIAGDVLTQTQHFVLNGSTSLTTVIPTHFTNPIKYSTLLERYLASTFKMRLHDGDLTPEILQGLNSSVAEGFTFVEDLANQMVDLLDANATSEGLLNLLANMFDLQLKSDDPTRWRRQIKQAIPLYKKKGTLDGLHEALSQAGMELIKITSLWQIISPYTWQEVFDVSDSTSFTLTKDMVLPPDSDNFELFYRGADDTSWTELTLDYVDFDNSSGETIVTWLGGELSFDPIVLEEGDSIRILYQINQISNSTQQAIEDYIRLLPLIDQRDERSQIYPKKNWNIRGIEEDDVMFDVVIAERHPFHDPVVFGKIRTEFPYSENIYNMDTYNGSKRDSNEPCDIDHTFLDPCRYCLSSSYNIDVKIEELTSDRVLELQQILEEYTPFHSQVHTINFSGLINDFVPAPQETIQALIQYQLTDVVIAGEGRYAFNRAVPLRTANLYLKRDMLADSTNMTGTLSGTASNNEIVIFSPYTKLGDIGINTTSLSGTPSTNSNWLEILAPHALAGSYSVSNPRTNYANIADVNSSISEPINTSQFTFRLSNRIDNDTVDITQDDYFTFTDANVDFAEIGVKSQFDLDYDDDYTGGLWTLTITTSGGDVFEILNVLPDGILLLDDPTEALPKTGDSGINWILKDDENINQASGTNGVLTVRRRAKVDFSSMTGSGGTIDDIRNLVRIGDYVLISSTQYKVISFGDEDSSGFTKEVIIDGYTSGDSGGVSAVIYRRLINNEIGYLSYEGLTLITGSDHESGLDIQNGQNPPATVVEDNKFKENFLVLIDTDYYAISDIDGTQITLNGPMRTWETDGNPVGNGSGTSVDYDIIKFIKSPVTIPDRNEPPITGHQFDGTNGLSSFIDRRGNEVIKITTEQSMSGLAVAEVLNATTKNDSNILDIIKQKENISYQIEWADDQGE